MTKHYMQFDNFKKLILEAVNPDELWPGGVCWSIRFTNEEKSEGVLDYYVIVKIDNNEEKNKSVIEKWLKDLKTESLPQNVATSIRWAISGSTLSKEKEIQLGSRDEKYYRLFRYAEKFSVVPPTKPDAAKENLKKYCATRIGNCNKAAKMYTLANGDLEKFAKKSFASADEESEEVKKYITKMIDDPDSFSGYDKEKLKDRIQKVSNMEMGEFVDKYGDYGTLEAMLAKGLINLLAMPGKMKAKREKEEADKKKTEEERAKAKEERKKEEEKLKTPPTWDEKWNSILAEAKVPGSEDLKSHINNYEVHKDNIDIELGRIFEDKSIICKLTNNNTVFEYMFPTIGTHTIRFILICKGFKPLIKDVNIFIKPFGESIIK